MTEAEAERVNEERHRLIYKKYHGGGLSDEEAEELARIKKAIWDYMAEQVRPELLKIFNARWERDEAAYRFLAHR